MQKSADGPAARKSVLDDLTRALAPATRARAEALWTLATTGEAAAADALAKSALAVDALLSDPERYLELRRVQQESAADEVSTTRALELLELQMGARQGDASLRAELVAKEAELRRAYQTHRGEVMGKAHSGAELTRILEEANDVELRREAWEATQSVGPVVREQVIEVVELRNEIARSLGYRDHYAMSLATQELSEEKLFSTLSKLEKATRTPFRSRKAVHDAELARRFECEADALQPWHYANPFFQSVGPPDSLPLAEHYRDCDLVDVATRFFDGLGLNVRPVLERSDLEPRAGKDEHAFCLHVDRDNADVRVLANLRPSERSMRTLLHELGHAAYDRYIGGDTWALRRPAHTLITEAVAMLMGRQSIELEFLLEYLDWPAAELTPLSGELRRVQSFRMQVFTRWVLVVTHFERALYADPRAADLDAQWWELKRKYQLVTCAEARDTPDWAAKRHLALSPVYYQNYLYGELVASQLKASILEGSREKSIVDSLFAGEFLIQEVFSHGATLRWDTLLERATGAPLDTQHFIKEFAG